MIQSGNLTVDLARHITTLNGNEIKLTSTEFKLLSYLAANPDRVLTHQAILTHVWGFEESEPFGISTGLYRAIRKKIEIDPDNPKILITDPGVGYRFKTYD